MSGKTTRSDDVTRLQELITELSDVVLRNATTTSAGRQERLRKTVDDITKTLLDVARRPDEPIDVNVVTFSKKWHPDEPYTFAALKAGNGWWYLTGTETRYSWEQLLDFIGQNLPTLRYLAEVPE